MEELNQTLSELESGGAGGKKRLSITSSGATADRMRNELTERTLKDVLTACVTDTYLPIITAQVQLTNDSVSYAQLCDHIVAHENILV